MFRFKKFTVEDSSSAMKVGTDGVLVGAMAIGNNPVKVLDIGAGSGLIALMMAQRWPHANITAVEMDTGSIADMRHNVESSPWSDRIDIVEGDALTLPLPAGEWDVIACNPPFFTESLRSPDPRRASARHESTLGIGTLITLSAQLLSPWGMLTFIAPATRCSEIDFMLASARLSPGFVTMVRQREDLPAKRAVYTCSLTDGPTVRKELTISSRDGYTEPYRRLVSDYYLFI